MPTGVSVLLVEDDANDAELIARALRQGGYTPHIQRVDTLAAVDASLAATAFDVVLCDYRLIGFSGLDVLDLVRRRGAEIPFIFVSGHIGEDAAVEAMRLGAQDYVMKGNLGRLAPAIARELGEAALRDRAQRETRAAQARLADILGIAADAIISVDESQRITVFNRGAEAIFGYTASEVLGATLTLLLPSAVAGVHASHVRGFGNGPDDARRMGERAQVHGRRKDGTEFPAEASISRLRTEHGWVFTAILRDITDQRRAQARLGAYAHELERTNRELQEYAYAVAHDLRAPLRNIASFAQLLRAPDPDRTAAQADGYLAFIESSALRLQRLLAALLEVDRVSRERHPLTQVDLGQALSGACEQLRDVLTGSGAQLSAAALPRVTADEALVVLLFQNLLENAVKFARPGQAPRIDIRARRPEDADEWEIAVSDHGVGIDPALAPHAFELFRRLHAPADYPGTGLGLAVCRRIVEGRHGGRIWLESDGVSGATVSFTLPDHPVPGPGLASESAPLPGE